MTTYRSTTTEPLATVPGLGSAGTSDLKIVFPGSPINNGQLSDANLRSIFVNGVLTPFDPQSVGYWGQVMKRDFSDAPDLTTVDVGGGGKPGVPYAPNVASPALDSGLNPTTIPDAGAGATARAPHGGGAFYGNGLLSPNETSAKTAQQALLLGNYLLGSAFRR